MLQWNVSAEESGMRLQSFLKLKLGEEISARQVKQSIENNCCTVNSHVERFASAKIVKGDKITFALQQTVRATTSKMMFEQSRVLFEDSDFLIYDKPPGIASDNEDFITTVRRNLPELILIHRLDRDTTGILMFSKNAKTFESMKELFKNLEVHKTYLALVDGIMEKKEGTIDNYLGKVNLTVKQAVWGKVSPAKGLHAVTKWVVEKKGKQACLVRCYPKTGRTHQIRVHMNELGHPILGDGIYGKKFVCDYKPKRCLLHASEIEFAHPKTHKKILVKAPLPADFSEAIKQVLGTV